MRGLSCAEGRLQASRLPESYEGSKGVESLLFFLLPHFHASSPEKEGKKTKKTSPLGYLVWSIKKSQHGSNET